MKIVRVLKIHSSGSRVLLIVAFNFIAACVFWICTIASATMFQDGSVMIFMISDMRNVDTISLLRGVVWFGCIGNLVPAHIALNKTKYGWPATLFDWSMFGIVSLVVASGIFALVLGCSPSPWNSEISHAFLGYWSIGGVPFVQAAICWVMSKIYLAKRRQRVKNGRCIACGHVLIVDNVGRCPECGRQNL